MSPCDECSLIPNLNVDVSLNIFERREMQVNANKGVNEFKSLKGVDFDSKAG